MSPTLFVSSAKCTWAPLTPTYANCDSNDEWWEDERGEGGAYETANTIVTKFAIDHWVLDLIPY